MKSNFRPRTAVFAAMLASSLMLGCSKDEGTEAGAISGGTSASTAPAAKVNLMGAGPAETMNQAAQLMRSNDLGGMLKAVLPDAQYKEMAAEWEKTRKEPISDNDRKEFADLMAKVNSPTAIDDLIKEAEPKLIEMKAQLPMLIGMGMMTAQQGIQASEDFTAAQKEQLTSVLNATQTWAMKTDFADTNRMRKALTELSNGVKAMKLESLEQISAMNFEQVLGKGSVMFASVKRAFNAYDLNLDEAMSSFKAEQVSIAGDTAKIRTTMKFLGQEIASESDMVKIDGRWFSKDSIDSIEKMAEAKQAADALESASEQTPEKKAFAN